MLGVLVNMLTVTVGSALGLLLKKGLPEKIKTVIMSGMALCVLYVGISGTLESNNAIIVVASIALGAFIGALIGIDSAVNRLGDWITDKVKRKGGNLSNIGEGFVSGTLLFCVGAMTVVGSLEAGITGDNSTLFTKAMIDMVAALVLTTTLGGGVMLSTVAIGILQGGIVLLATFIQPLLTDAAIAEMSAVGSIMIMGIGVNMLGLTKIKVADMMPAIVIAPILCRLITG